MPILEPLDAIMIERGENSLTVIVDKKRLTDHETREELLKVITLNLDVNGIESIVLRATRN